MQSAETVILAAGAQPPWGLSQSGVVRRKYADSLMRPRVSKVRKKTTQMRAEGKKNIVKKSYVLT